MRRIIQNILFAFSLFSLFLITIYLCVDNFSSYDPFAIANITINYSALILGSVMALLIIIDKTRQFNHYTISFGFLLGMTCLLSMISTIEWIANNKNIEAIIHWSIDIARIYCELIIYILLWQYISTILRINKRTQKKVSLWITILGFICCSIYAVHLLLHAHENFEFLVFGIGVYHLPIIIFCLCVNIVYICVLVNHSKNIFETYALGILCIASVAASILVVSTDLDVGNLIYVVALLICFSSIYLKHVYENRQAQLIGKELQKSLLTTDFNIMKDKIDVYAKTLPAGEVGGNFYDIYNKDERHLTFALADTPGIGLPAALTMTGAISLLRGLIDASMHVNGIAQQMSYRIRTDTARDTQLSLWLGSIDFDTSTLTYVNAGECIFIILRNSKPVSINNKPNPKIGSSNPEKYRAHTIDLQPGDKIILFTKSMKQIRNTNNELISDDAIKIILDKKNTSSKQYCDEIFNYINEFSTSKSRTEDITMIILQYKNEENIISGNDENIEQHNDENNKLNIEVQEENKQVNVIVEGGLIKQTVNEFNKIFNKAIDKNTSKIINFDFSKISLIDAYGMRNIINSTNNNSKLCIKIKKRNEYVDKFLKDNGLFEMFCKKEDDD